MGLPVAATVAVRRARGEILGKNNTLGQDFPSFMTKVSRQGMVVKIITDGLGERFDHFLCL